ncbi:MAG: hypothetical protein B6242_17225 [Anaerolineaceae bacterium 4572_78]|nr:MAG: hypothetical protein B6242_17225 [Anaerolineaceae bacterium 4572_78]
MSDSGKYLLDLINDILDLTKADVGQINIEINNFHLPNFLKGIVDTCHSRIKEKNITFTYKHDTHIPTYVKTDARRLRQILMNILDNAIKFTKQGEITFTVNLCSSQEIPESVLYTLPISPKNNVLLVRFQIKDTGIGIPNDELNSIFESFKQVTYPYHFVEGTGLGLFIGQRLANLMGSKIKVKSTIEKGSIFWFDMPLVKIPVQATSQAGTQKMIIGFEGDDTQHILIIDDKPDSCAVLRDILVPLGFEVTEAFSGFEGLKKARQIQPDIILVDLRMPNMDGFELTRQIRQILELQTTIVIAISASATEEIRQASLAAGCDDFLAKPVEMLLMLQCLERHLPLKWLYNIDDRISTYNSKNVQSEFVIPPPEEIAKLQELVQIGDVVGIWEWVEKIEQLGSQFQPYAIEVHKLAKQFRMTEIHELIEMMQTS